MSEKSSISELDDGDGVIISGIKLLATFWGVTYFGNKSLLTVLKSLSLSLKSLSFI